jgi:hypothetical protein
LSNRQPLPTDLNAWLSFETLVGDLAAEFVNLPPEHVDGAIEDAQRRIVQALDLDRSVLWEFVDADGSLLFTHVWSRPEPSSGSLDAIADPRHFVFSTISSPRR